MFNTFTALYRKKYKFHAAKHRRLTLLKENTEIKNEDVVCYVRNNICYNPKRYSSI